MIERKEITPVSIGGRTLFDLNDLHDLIEKSKKPIEETGKRRGRKPLDRKK
jgi:hypothetical protein